MANPINTKIDISSSGDNTIINAPGAGLKIKILSMILVCTSAVTVTLKSTSVSITGPISFASNGGLGFGSDLFPLVLNTNEAFIINISGNIQVSGFVNYIIGS